MTKDLKTVQQASQLDLYNSGKEEIFNIIQQGLYSGQPLLGENGIFSKLIKQVVEASLNGELDAHIADNKLEEAGVNRKNGYGQKKLKTGTGDIIIDIPRDRSSSFEPQLIKKRQNSINEELNNKILALYSLGNSYEDISSHLQDIYGIEVSNSTISSVTDKLIPELNEWKSRPLEKIYTVIFLDAMFFKARKDNLVVTKVLYNIMGINCEGRKEILGFYVNESEGAHFWLGVLNDLKARGVSDVLIACIDGLAGFPEAISSVFPQTEIQLCIVHQIRNSLKHIASKNQKEFMVDLKKVYQAINLEQAEYNFLLLEEKWGDKYPMVIKSWRNNWDNLFSYFKYSHEVRKLVYTTNPIEGFHRQVRKYTKTKGAFTSENALLKLVFCAIKAIDKKWSQPLHNWGMTISQLDIYFPGRLNLRG